METFIKRSLILMMLAGEVITILGVWLGFGAPPALASLALIFVANYFFVRSYTPFA